MNRFAFLSAAIGMCFAVAAFAAPTKASNPSPDEVKKELIAVANEERIPSAILLGLAWKASKLRQFDPATGKPIETIKGRFGILGVPLDDRFDADKLRTDWRYNLRSGAKLLVHAWYRAPLPGTSRLSAGRNILECWFPALGWYGTGGWNGFKGREGAEAHTYANSVLDAVATGGSGLWEPVAVSRPTPQELAWGRNLLATPSPQHYGDVPEPAPATVVVKLPVPYLAQAWDVPDGFDGSGSCGPCSSLMALLAAKKIATPKAIEVKDSYPHTSPYGSAIPSIYKGICMSGVGAVHAKMLNYLRPYFPGVAIFYDAKANWERVKKELDAGRPVILGTRVTSAGHIMVARGYMSDGRVIVNDPAGDREQLARLDGPEGEYSPTGSRYWNGGGDGAVYEWDDLDTRWIMTLTDTKPADADPPEDEDML